MNDVRISLNIRSLGLSSSLSLLSVASDGVVALEELHEVGEGRTAGGLSKGVSGVVDTGNVLEGDGVARAGDGLLAVAECLEGHTSKSLTDLLDAEDVSALGGVGVTRKDEVDEVLGVGEDVHITVDAL